MLINITSISTLIIQGVGFETMDCIRELDRASVTPPPENASLPTKSSQFSRHFFHDTDAAMMEPKFVSKD